MLPKNLLMGAVGAGFAAALLVGTPAHADLVWKGITYSLTETSTANPEVYQFTLNISGINAATDEEGGRSGISALAFNLPEPKSGFVSAQMIDPTGFNFLNGGLASAGCNSTGNFFCFDNVGVPPTPTTPYAADSSLAFVFDVTVTPGTLLDEYNPAFKIDWVGSQNHYDLVSQELGDPTYVPEPASLALLGSGLFGMAGLLGLRRRWDTQSAAGGIGIAAT